MLSLLKNGVSECNNDDFLYISKAYACMPGVLDTEHHLKGEVLYTDVMQLGGLSLMEQLIYLYGTALLPYTAVDV